MIDKEHVIAVVAQNYALFAVINAMVEKGIVDHHRIIAWAEVFASGFDQNSSCAENPEVADRLRQFATTLRLMSAPPDRSGMA